MTDDHAHVVSGPDLRMLRAAVLGKLLRCGKPASRKRAERLAELGYLAHGANDGEFVPTDATWAALRAIDVPAAPIAASEPVPPLPYHPLADIFPLIEGEAFAQLVEDVAANGVRDKIMLLDGQILDGRNRYRAGIEAGFFKPAGDGGPLPFPHSMFVSFEAAHKGADPLAWVISKNLARRHLTDDQRRMVAARVATMRRGGNPASRFANGEIDRKKAAEMLAVDVAGVDRARAVVSHGAPELQAAVDQRRVTVRMAADLVALPPDQQREIVASADPKALAAVVRDLRAAKTAAKREKRDAREVELAAKIVALPARRYGVILADPEWRFQPFSRETGMDRAPDNHYPTSTTEAISARDVASIAADDCVLFLWATSPMLRDALHVLTAWGFGYRSHVVWVKERAGDGRGTGFWFLGEHELLLVGVRGKVPAPAFGTQWRSVISAPVGEHSAKPEASLEMIEAYFPNIPKIELNRRGPARPGWDAWGAETGDLSD